MNTTQSKYQTTDNLLRRCKECNSKLFIMGWRYCNDKACEAKRLKRRQKAAYKRNKERHYAAKKLKRQQEKLNKVKQTLLKQVQNEWKKD